MTAACAAFDGCGVGRVECGVGPGQKRKAFISVGSTGTDVVRLVA